MGIVAAADHRHRFAPQAFHCIKMIGGKTANKPSSIKRAEPWYATKDFAAHGPYTSGNDEGLNQHGCLMTIRILQNQPVTRCGRLDRHQLGITNDVNIFLDYVFAV